LIVGSGAVFRQHWNGENPIAGDEYTSQKIASLSQARFINYLSPMKVDLMLNTYRCSPDYDSDLISWTNPTFINYLHQMPNEDALFEEVIRLLSNMDLSSYSFILFIRPDFFLYDYFSQVFNPFETRIMFAHVDAWKGQWKYVEELKTFSTPGVCHNIIFIPPSAFNVLISGKFWKRHQSLESLENTEHFSNVGFYINTFHLANTAFEWNPLYAMVGRPSPRILLNRGKRYNISEMREETVDSDTIYDNLIEYEDPVDWVHLFRLWDFKEEGLIQNNSRDLYVSFNLGVGSHILLKALCDFLLDINLIETVYYTVQPHGLRKEYGESFHTGLIDIARLLTSGRNYKHVQYCNSIPGSHELIRKIIPTGKVPLRLNYDVGDSIIGGDYVVLNMKLSNFNLTDTDAETLINIFNRSKYPVVLMGERNITTCFEYNVLPDHISLYEKVGSKIANSIDKTYDQTSSENDKELFIRNCNIYKYSKYNVCINSSGGLAMVSMFGNVIGLTSGCSPWDDVIEFSSSYLTSDINAFLKLLKDKITD
jgi:hypothetical protein